MNNDSASRFFSQIMKNTTLTNTTLTKYRKMKFVKTCDELGKTMCVPIFKQKPRLMGILFDDGRLLQTPQKSKLSPQSAPREVAVVSLPPPTTTACTLSV